MLSPQQALMIQGTTSDAGKTLLVAGLCRVLARKGHKVAPFKPQNMALNSAVTDDGGEIGRAQALQAQAAFLSPSVHMNPVLLKPNTDIGAQIIVQGKAIADMNAIDYNLYKKTVMSPILDSFSYLQQNFDTIIVEGAGSPAEINLRENDVANMGFAEEVDIPVVIIADIDKGGVFAHLYGTLALLSKSEQDRVIGFVINRFRGDIGLLQSGLDWLEERTGKPVLGVLPYIHGLMLDAEDAIDVRQSQSTSNQFTIVVPVFPRISNHTDFDALRVHPDVNVIFVGKGQPLPPADLIILPGSKSVRADLAFLKEQKWDLQIQRHLRYGGKVIGICGGFQMLGQHISDPFGLEGEIGVSDALGYFDIETTLAQEKQLFNRTGILTLPNQSPAHITGYEIHAGITKGISKTGPIQFDEGSDGVLSYDDQIFGTYWHGCFDAPEACQALLQWAGLTKASLSDFNQVREVNINKVADVIEQHCHFDKVGLNW